MVKSLVRRGKKIEFFILPFCAFNIVEIFKMLKLLVGSGLNQICNLAELISLNDLSIIKIELFLMGS